MAGIGFELRKLLDRGTIVSVLQAYSIAGIVSSGPWIISILGIFAIGIMVAKATVDLPSTFVGEFQVSVTYLMATSLIFTGPLQFLLARFISDRHYEKRDELILPNLFGAITLVTLASGTLATVVLGYYFSASLVYRVLMLTGFVLLCNIWVVVVLLSAAKAWKLILTAFAVAYGITVSVALSMRDHGPEGLLFGFVAGNGMLLFTLLSLMARTYPVTKVLSFDFLRRSQVFISLAFTGLFYNFAIWADKFIFWFNPMTGETVIPPLRYSPLYDLPIFLAYLSIVPGMTVFLLRVETDFSVHCERFYSSILRGATLEQIQNIKTNMVASIRQGIFDIFKVQGMTVLILVAFAPQVLAWVGIPPLYRVLLNVDLVGVGVQMLLLTILNVLFYLDKRRVALLLTAFYAFSNICLTVLTQVIGPAAYGYGFAVSGALTAIVGLMLLSRKLERLEYEMFMLQPTSPPTRRRNQK
jgi:polysaccharide biosynthesis protein PelG